MKLHPVLLAGLLIIPAQTFAQTVMIGTATVYDAGEYTVDETALQGFEQALSEAICERGKLTCVWKAMPKGDLAAALKAKEIDVMMAAIPSTEKLGDGVDLTAPYLYPDPYDFVGKPGTNLHGDVQTVARIADPAVDVWAASSPFSFKVFPSFEEAMVEVNSGGAQTMIGEREALDPLMAESSAHGLAIIHSRRLRPGVAMALHADNIDLRFNFEDRIYDMTQDGSLNALTEKWFGIDAEKL